MLLELGKIFSEALQAIQRKIKWCGIPKGDLNLISLFYCLNIDLENDSFALCCEKMHCFVSIFVKKERWNVN